jgi:hypothetical protein
MSRSGSAPALGSAKERIREARQALEAARSPLKTLRGCRFVHRVGQKTRSVVVEEVDPLRLRVYVRGSAAAGWIEVSTLGAEKAEEEVLDGW